MIPAALLVLVAVAAWRILSRRDPADYVEAPVLERIVANDDAAKALETQLGPERAIPREPAPERIQGEPSAPGALSRPWKP